MKIKKIKKSHSQQLDHSDCGVTCLLTILKYYNSSYSLEKLREYSGTSKQGTTMLGLLQCANNIGLESKGYESSIEAIKDIKYPIILHTIYEDKLQHYIVCFGYEDKKNKFIISNPANKKIDYINEQYLNEIWKSKALLLFKQTDNLIKNVTTYKQKWKWIFNYIKDDLNLLLTSLFLGVLLAILGLATAVYSQKLIDVLIPSNDSFQIIASICLLFLLFILQTFFYYLRGKFLIRQTKDYNIRVIKFFYNSLLKLPKLFFDSRRTGDLVARMNDTSRIQKTISKIIGNVMIDFLLVFVVTIAIFSYSKTLGLISLFWIPVFSLIVIYFNPKINKLQKVVMQSYANNESNYIDTIEGIETIKTNNKELFYSNYTTKVYRNFQQSIYELSNCSLKYTTISQFISSVFVICTLGYSISLVLNNELTTGAIIAILQLVGILMSSSSNLALINIEIQEAKIAFNRMFEFTSIEKEKINETKIKTFNRLQIQDLSFRFNGRKQLLKNIDLEINKGELVAIVGESGSGKSTLGQILQKFYAFENGNIRVNDIQDFNSLNISNWRSLIGVIPQEIKIFNGNVLDNLLLGTEDSFENVVKFCQEYGFEKFITEFPQGYETIIGEEGINLSGGQKQIIALARALYKKPQFLILDEATSAMDRNTEKFTMNLLSKLKNEIAVLFISHRLHTLKNNADRIYVLENGNISNEGNHEKLLETSNFYSDYWTI